MSLVLMGQLSDNLTKTSIKLNGFMPTTALLLALLIVQKSRISVKKSRYKKRNDVA